MAGENAAQLLLTAKDEASRVIDDVASELGGLGRILQKLATSSNVALFSVAGLGAAAAGAVILGSQLSDAVEQLDLLSAKTGVSTENLQVLSEIVDEAGGNSESLSTALSFLNRAIAQGNPLLAQMGITTKDTFTAFEQLAKKLDESGDAGKKTAVAMQLFGRGGAELLGTIHDLATGTDTMREKMEAAGNLIGGQTREQARLLDAQMDTLHRDWEGSLTRIKAATLPWATEMVSQFNQVWDAIRGVKPAVEDAETMITNLEERLAALQKAADFQKRLSEGQPTTQDFLNAPGAAAGSKVQQSVRDYYAGLLKNSTADMTQIANDLGLLKQGMEAGRAAIDAEKAALGAAGDALAGLNLDEQATKEKEDRIKKIMDLLAVLHQEEGKPADFAKSVEGLKALHAEAEGVVNQLDAIQRAGDASDLSKKLTLGPEASESVKEFNKNVEDTIRDLGVSNEDAIRLVRQMEEFNKAAAAESQRKKLGIQSDKPFGPEERPKDLPKTTDETLDEWQKALDAITGSANVLDDTLSGVFNSLQSGFRSAFDGILSGAMSLGEGLKTVFKSIVSAILDELARIAAAKVIGFILGGFSNSGASGAPAHRLSSAVAPVRSESSLDLARNVQPSVVNNYNTTVQTYDARDTVRDLLSMNGRQRQANSKLSFMGEN